MEQEPPRRCCPNESWSPFTPRDVDRESILFGNRSSLAAALLLLLLLRPRLTELSTVQVLECSSITQSCNDAEDTQTHRTRSHHGARAR